MLYLVCVAHMISYMVLDTPAIFQNGNNVIPSMSAAPHCEIHKSLQDAAIDAYQRGVLDRATFYAVDINTVTLTAQPRPRVRLEVEK